MKRGLILAAVLTVATVGTASAATSPRTRTLGTVYNTTDVEDTTWGDEMGGMTVVATLINQQGVGDPRSMASGPTAAFGLGGVINWVDLFGDDEFNLSVWGDTYTEGIWNLNFDFDSGELPAGQPGLRRPSGQHGVRHEIRRQHGHGGFVVRSRLRRVSTPMAATSRLPTRTPWA